MNYEKLTTGIGIAGALLQGSQVDVAKIATGDTNEIAKAGFAGVMALLGWATNKKKKGEVEKH